MDISVVSIFFAIMNNAVNILFLGGTFLYDAHFYTVHVFNSFEYIPRSGTAGSYGTSRLNLLRNCQTSFPSSVHEGSNISIILSILLVFLLIPVLVGMTGKGTPN